MILSQAKRRQHPMQRGRKSIASRLAIAARSHNLVTARPVPDGSLNKREKQIFVLTYKDNPHLRDCDSPLVTCFAVAAARMEGASKIKDVADIERLVRATLALGRSLRITQQSRTDPKTLSRQVRDQVKNTGCWPLADDDDDEAEPDAG
jgi:hypothetical protein